MRLVRETAAIIEFGFYERSVARPEAVDVPPRSGAREGEFIRGGAHDGAVFLVEGEEGVGLAATEEIVRVEGVGPGGGGGARELVEGMCKVGIEDFGQEKDEDLST